MQRFVYTTALAFLAGLPTASAGPGVPDDDDAAGQVVEVRLAPPAEGTAALEAGTASSTTVLSSETPGARTTLSDLLRVSPGADLRRAGAPGGREELLVRGASGQQLVVVLDGVPLGAARGGAFDLSMLPPAYVEQLTLLRGPVSALYGSGAFAGALLARTPTAPEGTRLTGGLRLGQLESRAAELGFSRREGRFEVLALGGGSRANGAYGYDDLHGAPRTRRNADHVEAHGLVRGRVRFEDGASVVTLVEGLDQARGEPGFEQFENPAARSTRRRAQVAVAGDAGRAFASDWRFEALAWARGESQAFVDPQPVRVGAARRYETQDRAHGVRLATTYAGFGLHAPSAVLEVRRDTAETHLEGGLFGEGVSGTRTGVAAVLVEQWAAVPGWLHLSAAMRLDENDQRAPVWVPRAGAVVTLPLGFEARANVGRAFRDPGFDELYFESPGLRGNPDLRPEDGLVWDAGLAFAQRPFRLGLTFFEQRFDRLILFVPVQAFQIEARDDYAARARGLETYGDARLGPLGLTAHWTWLEARFEHTPHAPLPYRPTHRAFARAVLHAQQARLWATVEARGPVTTDIYGHSKLEGHRLFSLGVEGPLGGGLELGAEVHNAADVRDAVDAIQQPLPGRLWTVYLRKG